MGVQGLHRTNEAEPTKELLDTAGMRRGLNSCKALHSRPPGSGGLGQVVEPEPEHKQGWVSQRRQDPTSGKCSQETLTCPVDTLVVVTTAVDSAQLRK